MAQQDTRSAADTPAKGPAILQELEDFSLVLGGPTFQLLRKARLEGGEADLVSRRIFAITLITWLPLFVLAMLGAAGDDAGRLAFFRDVEVHARFLVALPVLIAAELVVHMRVRPAVRRFVESRLVLPPDLPRFHKAIESAVRLRNSVVLELGLLVLVYSLGLWLWNRRIVSSTPTWYASGGGRWDLTTAGLWYVFVSIPLVQFILLRWYVRLFIWFRFLWQVSRIDLNLIPTHPDRAGGLAFLGRSSYAFGPILFAQGAMLCGIVATRVLFRGENLLSFRLQIAGFIAFFVLVVLGPLLMFTPKMNQAKRKGLAEYGKLAQRYVEAFEQKWVRNDRLPADELLGAADIQSLADLGNSYSLVRDMRSFPFGLEDVSRLAIATAVPLLPLLLTVFSPEDLLARVIQVVF
jgi:hypothetical protein